MNSDRASSAAGSPSPPPDDDGREQAGGSPVSADAFALLVESVEDYAIFMLDPDGRVVSWNRGAERLKGYAASEIVGRHFSTFYTAEDRERGHPEEELRVARSEGRYREEGWRVRRDGTLFWADVTITAMREPGGRLRGFAKVTRDLTERRASEAAAEESESRLRALAENASEAIVTIDADDRIVFANAATSRIFGYEREALPSLPFTALIPLRFRSRHRAGMRRYLETGESRLPWDGIQLPGLRRDGSEVPLEITFSEYERDGRRFFSGIMRDITERTRTEAERRDLLVLEQDARGEAERRAEQEEALREAIEAVSAAFTVEETTRRIAESALVATRADRAIVEQIDVATGSVVVVADAGEAASAIGSAVPYQGSCTEGVLEREAPQVLRRIADAELRLPDGVRERYGTCSAAIIPLLNAGEPIGALFLLRRPEKDVFRDDEVRRAFSFGYLASLAFRKLHLLEDSERRREELQRVTESRARLMRGFSHDVKNPLGAADGMLQLLEEEVLGPVEPKARESLGRARRSLRSALALIDDLLDLARAEAGELDIQLAPTDLREASREMADEYRGQAEAAGLILEFEAPDRMPIVESDPTRVRQVISNLLSNAVKYTPEGGIIGVRVAVQWRDDRGHGWVAVHVEDTGPGIPDDMQDALFHEFTRMEPQDGKGAGIGLAISQRIADALGGRISLDSRVGEGSTFTLRLPLSEVGERREAPRHGDA